jgi:hypothetical protein
VRYVGFAALAATFWLLVATVRLVLHPPAPQRIAPVPQRIAAAPPQMTADSASRPRRYRHVPRDVDCGGVFGPDESDHTIEGSPLRRSALVAGLDAVRPSVSACYQAYQPPATVMVNVVIARNGRVSSATAMGNFAKTPTGACVERAVKAARFPRSSGFVATPYPFRLE